MRIEANTAAYPSHVSAGDVRDLYGRSVLDEIPVSRAWNLFRRVITSEITSVIAGGLLMNSAVSSNMDYREVLIRGVLSGALIGSAFTRIIRSGN